MIQQCADIYEPQQQRTPRSNVRKKKKNEGIILARLRKGRDINKMVEKSGNHRERERQEESEKKEESAPNDFGH